MATYQLPFTGDTIKSELQQLVNNKFTNVMSQTSSPAPLADNDEIPTTGWVQDEISSQLATKVDKVTGKGLSTNDYTNADKTNVDKIPSLLTEIQPVERGGAGATTAEGARTNLGLRTATARTEIRELLWENASPLSSFSGQTVNITGIENYDAIEVEYRGRNGGSIRFPIETSYEETMYSLFASVANNVIYFNSRTLQRLSNGIQFGDNLEISNRDSSTTQTQNARNIPYRVYGIKEV